jgi:hypothetical protein
VLLFQPLFRFTLIPKLAAIFLLLVVVFRSFALHVIADTTLLGVVICLFGAGIARIFFALATGLLFTFGGFTGLTVGAAIARIAMLLADQILNTAFSKFNGSGDVRLFLTSRRSRCLQCSQRRPRRRLSTPL